MRDGRMDGRGGVASDLCAPLRKDCVPWSPMAYLCMCYEHATVGMCLRRDVAEAVGMM